MIRLFNHTFAMAPETVPETRFKAVSRDAEDTFTGPSISSIILTEWPVGIWP